MSDIYLSVAVCTHNRAALLGECVRSVLASCARLARPWELLVVDNASTDRTPDVLRDLSAEPRLRVIREEHLGVSHARNAAVANVSGRVLAFIDDDMLVREDWAPALCSEFEAQGVGLLGGLILPKWEAPPPWWLTHELQGPLALLESRVILHGSGRPIVYGGNCAFEREVVASLGPAPFNPELGRKGTRLIGNEETHLIERLWRNGVKIGFSENVVAWHRVPKRRMTIAWLLKWHFFWGVSTAREEAIDSERSLPPWRLFADLFLLAVLALCDLLTLRPRLALRKLFRLAERLGRIGETVRLALL